MKILEKETTSEGVIIKVVRYNIFEKLKKGYCYGVQYVTAKDVREVACKDEYDAKGVFSFELFKSLLSDVDKQIKHSEKDNDYKKYNEFILFLKHCFNIEYIDRSSCPSISDSTVDQLIKGEYSIGRQYTYIVVFKKETNIDTDILKKIGEFEKYALMDEELLLTLGITLNMVNNNSFDEISANIHGKDFRERIIILDNSSDTFDFICNYASLMY